MLFDVVLLTASVWWIHQDHIALVIIRVIKHVLCQGVIVHHFWRIDVMQEHIGDTQHVRELLLLNAID